MKRLLIVLVIVAFLLCGCGEKESEETQQRFVIETHEYRNALASWGSISIIRDTETGKEYMFVERGYSGGLTVLEEGE